MTNSIPLINEEATIEVARNLASVIKPGLITFHGDLGAGKTTFCRGLLRGLGFDGPVKSPTFTLVEPYEINNLKVMHFDLYRLEDPEELDFMGFRDYLSSDTLCLVEWPEKAAVLMPQADLEISLNHQGRQRSLSWQAHNKLGQTFGTAINQKK